MNKEQFLKQEKAKKRNVVLMQMGVLIFIVIVWQLLVWVGIADEFVVSSPVKITVTLYQLVADGTLWIHSGISLLETILGFVIGTALGYVTAVILWWFTTLQKVFEPYLVVLNSLPKIALGPIIIIWVGTGMASIITMAVLISVVITTISMLNGFNSVERDKLLLMRSFNATRWQVFCKLVAPYNVPTLMATLKINVGMSWVGSIMGEYLVSKRGLGYLIVYGSQVFRLDLVMTCTIVLCVLAGIMYAVVALVERKVSVNYM